MKLPFIIVLISISAKGFSQTPEEALEKCNRQLQQALNPMNPAKMEEDFGKEWKRFQGCVNGLPFPSFRATGIDGKFYTLDQLKGKVILINTWFIGCHPCEAELPSLNELNKEFAQEGFIILSFGRDQEASIQEFRKSHLMSFLVFANSEDLILKKFKIHSGYPTNILLNREGRIVEYKSGGPIKEAGIEKAKEELRTLIKKELKK